MSLVREGIRVRIKGVCDDGSRTHFRGGSGIVWVGGVPNSFLFLTLKRISP